MSNDKLYVEMRAWRGEPKEGEECPPYTSSSWVAGNGFCLDMEVVQADPKYIAEMFAEAGKSMRHRLVEEE